jgi:hypothetical protein
MNAAKNSQTQAKASEQSASAYATAAYKSQQAAEAASNRAEAAADSIVEGSTWIHAAIDALEKEKADKTYMVTLFEELKSLILAGNTESAVALLDQAILDNAVLA